MTNDTSESLGQTVSLVYDELRRIAHRLLLGVRAFETLATTGLVNETYLKLIEQANLKWRGQSHLLALASVTMRHILIDKARARMADKRGGGHGPVTLEDGHAYAHSPAELLEIDDALTALEKVDARLARVVELRFYAGYPEAEIAAALGVTVRTVQRDWGKARVILRRALMT